MRSSLKKDTSGEKIPIFHPSGNRGSVPPFGMIGAESQHSTNSSLAPWKSLTPCKCISAEMQGSNDVGAATAKGPDPRKCSTFKEIVGDPRSQVQGKKSLWEEGRGVSGSLSVDNLQAMLVLVSPIVTAHDSPPLGS